MGEIQDDARLRDRRFVFHDRHDAGRQLGTFVRALPGIADPVVLAIPAGGVPVGIMLVKTLTAPFGLAIVRKIRIPGSTEAGFGAVAWDGSVLINERLQAALGLGREDVGRAIAATRQNVRQRVEKFAGILPPVAPGGKTAILTDDGLASGYTMLAAIRSLRKTGPRQIVVAVPTGSSSSVELISREADRVVCLNIRSGRTFAVADAYEQWYDLEEREVYDELRQVTGSTSTVT